VSKVEVVVEAAHRFRPPDDEQSAKTKLGLLITRYPECFEPRDVTAWAAYLGQDALSTPSAVWVWRH
jgi:hypothetical protein